MRALGAFEGPVTFEGTVDLAGERASFSTHLNIRLGSLAQTGATFRSAARTSSVPITTASVPSSWGALKALYH